MAKQASTIPSWKILVILAIIGIVSLLWIAVEGVFVIAATKGLSWAVPFGFLILTIAAVAMFITVVFWKPWQSKKAVAKQSSPQPPVVRRVDSTQIWRGRIPGAEWAQISLITGWFKSKWPIFAGIGIYVVLWLVLRLIYGGLEWAVTNLHWDANVLSRFLFSVEMGIPAAAVYFATRTMNMIIVTIAGEATHAYNDVSWGYIVGVLWWKTLAVFAGGFLLTLITGWQVELFALLAAWAAVLAFRCVEANRTKGGGI